MIPQPAGSPEISEEQAMTDAVSRSGLAVAQIDLATGRIVSASPAGVALLRTTVADAVGRSVADFIIDDPGVALPLLATGRLDGFEAARRLRCADGTVLDAYVWVRVVGEQRPARFAMVVVMPEPEQPGIHAAAPSDDLRVIGTVDEEWRLERISADVHALLGYEPSELAGVPLLSAVHPNDVSELLTGLAHVHETGRGSVVRLRVRRSDGTWLWSRAHLASLDESPQFAFTLRPLADSPTTVADRARELEQRLARIAGEIRAAGLHVPSPQLPVLAEIPEMATLTAREWEVVSALANGHRVPAIADRLALSPSTVRNHLSSVFRKLGVSSQAELLERLRAGSVDRRQVSTRG
jgi:PAS domain S-box-containing protein